MKGQNLRAVMLDGLTIVLDLENDAYLAVPQGGPDRRADRLQAAEAMGAKPSDIAFSDHQLVSPARWDLDGCGLPGSGRPAAKDWIRLVAAMPTALWSLKFGRPRTWVAGGAGVAREASIASIDAARRFRSMRPFVPWLSRCLPHALLLKAFLRSGGHDAALVIGVRLFPFEAHSWVQSGHVVLTDDLEQTAGYTPIVAG